MAALKVEALAHRHRGPRRAPRRPPRRPRPRAARRWAPGPPPSPVSAPASPAASSAPRRPPRCGRWRRPIGQLARRWAANWHTARRAPRSPSWRTRSPATSSPGSGRRRSACSPPAGRPSRWWIRGAAGGRCCRRGWWAPARRRARRAVARLAPHAVAGRPIVVLEPSCWSMLVDDLPRLLPGDPRARWVADAAVTFERAVVDLGPPALAAGPRGAAARALPRQGARARGRGRGGAGGGPGPGEPRLGRRLLRHGRAPSATAIASCRCGSPRTAWSRPCAAPPASPSRRARPAGSRSAAPPGRPALHPAELLAERLA